MNTLSLFLACIALSSATRAQCFDWSNEFQLNGVGGGIVTAQAVFDDGSGPALFVGGAFTTIAGLEARGIAKWNGSQWTTFGDGVVSTGTQLGVRALEVFDDGSGPALYAGGEFISIGGTAASNIARWNGTTWSAVGGGTNNVVYALEVFNDGSGPALYAGGAFTQAGGSPADFLAKWNGSSWSDVPGSFSLGAGVPIVRALGARGGELFVGGRFYTVGGASSYSIARWNGSTWSALNFGVSSLGVVNAIAVYDSGSGPDVYIAGSFNYNNGGGDMIASWRNGPFLSAVGNTSISAGIRLYDVQTLHVFDNGTGPKLYVGGRPYAHGDSPLRAWNGSTWSTPAFLSLAAYDVGYELVNSLGSFDDGNGSRLFASGRFADAGGLDVNGFASWNGAAWTAYGTSNTVNRPVRALATFDDGAGTDLYAAGTFDVAGNTTAYAIARFDGQAWSALTPFSNGPIYALNVFDDGSGARLYAAGQFNGIGAVAANSIARWNGTSWSPLANGIPTGFDQWVNALATYGGALYAAGRFTHAGALNNVNRVAKWDGSAWSKLGNGLDSEAYALAEFDDGSGARLYVGGAFTSAGGIGASYVASWNGTSWSALGAGVANYVNAFAVFDDGSGPSLYVGGAFQQAGGASANYIARWDGANWHDVGGGVNAKVEALHVFDDGNGPALYVAGSLITSAGGAPVRGVARWNGAQWSAVGGGVLGFAMNAMTSFDDGAGPALFVGGDIVEAGSSPSFNVAKWSRACTCPPVSYCTSGTSSNGCVPSIGASGTASASGSGSFVVTASNVEGQKLGLLFYGMSGATSSPWGATSSFLCVKPPQQRTGQFATGGTSGLCDGALVLDFNAYVASHPTSLGQPFSVGDTVRMQGWYRDPPNPKTTSLTNALEFYVCP